MKPLLIVILLLISVSLYGQENDNWYHFEGVNNPEYKVYLDKTTMDYKPGVTIIADIKYVYTSDSLLNYSIRKIKFFIREDKYQILSTRNYYFNNDDGKTEKFSISTNPPPEHLIPGSEMSIIYQYVYIQAVTIGPTKK